MVQIHAESSALIAARPADVYALLADYRDAHPRILPPEHFLDLAVEAGGQGAGTIFRVRTRVGGAERSYHMTVTEPEAGRLLMERDTASNLVTTFTVTPVGGGAQARVRIATDWEAGPGLMGVLERLFSPMLLRQVYAKELRRLAEVVQSKKGK